MKTAHIEFNNDTNMDFDDVESVYVHNETTPNLLEVNIPLSDGTKIEHEFNLSQIRYYFIEGAEDTKDE